MWDGSEWEYRAKRKGGHAAGIAIFGHVTVWLNEINENNKKKKFKNSKN